MRAGADDAGRAVAGLPRQHGVATARKRLALIAVAVVWTAAAGLAAGLILEDPPRVLEIGGHPFFFAGIQEPFWLWCLGLAVLAAYASPASGTRKAVVAGTALAAIALLVVVLAPLFGHRPPRQAAPPDLGDARTDRTTLLVAVDGMSWSGILPMVRRGELPTIGGLMEEGSYGVLHSLRTYRKSVGEWGYWSPVVWTSIATGVGPRRHGIVDFTLREGRGRPKLAASFHRKAPAFWNLFSSFGQTVAVVGWWASWPAEEISGYMASSHLGLRGTRRGKAPRYALTHPEELAGELEDAGLTEEELRDWVHEEVFRFDAYPILTRSETRTMYSVLWQDRLYQEIALELIRNRETCDLYAVYFEGIDALSHHFWAAARGEAVAVPPTFPTHFDDHRTAVPAYYRIVDAYLAELLAALPSDVTVLVVSDHGFEVDPAHAKRADHAPYGVLLARGPGIARGKNLNLDLAGSLRERVHGTTDVLDVLPTLLYLHGLPVAGDLPGTVATALLTDELLGRQPLVQVQSYGRYDRTGKVEPVLDPAASEEYEDRLRALGYVQ